MELYLVVVWVVEGYRWREVLGPLEFLYSGFESGNGVFQSSRPRTTLDIGIVAFVLLRIALARSTYGLNTIAFLFAPT